MNIFTHLQKCTGVLVKLILLIIVILKSKSLDEKFTPPNNHETFLLLERNLLIGFILNFAHFDLFKFVDLIKEHAGSLKVVLHSVLNGLNHEDSVIK